jgi:hypothetical protein
MTIFDNYKNTMVMKELHEEPLGGYFAFEITEIIIGCWILVANYV